MFNFKRVAMLLTAIMLLALAACQPQTQVVEVEVTRVVTETVTEVVEGETVEVEVTRVVEVAPEEEVAPVDKDLIVCMAQEPSSLYVYGGSMLVQTAVMHAIFENNFNTISFAYQAQGIEKMPSLADGDAVLNSVEVVGGEIVVGADTNVITLTEGVEVINSAGETVVFDGTPIMMDQLVVDFTLKPRVWSDGEPVKASDSVYSFNVNAHPDTPASKFGVERTASYEATGDLTLQWTGIPGFRDSVYFTRMWTPLPEHLWGELSPAEMVDAEQVARNPIGDGAFVLVEWRPGESIYLERNENYYRAAEGLPYLDSVTYKFVPDTNTLVAQLISGECDIATQDGGMDSLSPFLKQAEANGLIIPYFTTGTVYEHLDFNISPYGEYADSRPDWFEDVRVRQAMTMCVNRQSLVDTILYGESEVIHTYVPSIHPLYPEDVKEWPYDVEAANALLDEVGFVDSDGDGIREYTDGTPFAVTLGTTAGNEMRQKSTQIIQSNFKDCGINAELYYLPSSEWFADGPDGPLFGRRYDLGLFAWLTGVEPACNLYLSSEIPGPSEEINPFTGQPYQGWGASNNTGWSSPEFDAICQAALGSLPGTPEYEENHKEAQRIFAENVPIIPLFLRLKVAAARTNVVNFSVDPTQNSELYNIFEFDLR